MAKKCTQDCFIPGGPNFKKGDIIADQETLKLIGNSSNFEEYETPAERPKKVKKGVDNDDTI